MGNNQANKPKYTNSDIAVIALYQLGGALRHMHQEDVALKAAQLSPKAFSWKKYPEQINLETVRLALKNELDAKGKRILGSIRDGWMLTPEGLSWCLADSNEKIYQSPVDQIRKEVARVKRTEAFTKIEANRLTELSEYDFKTLLRIDEYFSPRNRIERVAALANAAVIDKELLPVLSALKRCRFIEAEVKP